jgi:fatty acid desaturase
MKLPLLNIFLAGVVFTLALTGLVGELPNEWPAWANALGMLVATLGALASVGHVVVRRDEE